MSTTFHCQNCGRVTDVSNLLRAFEDNPHCPQCGLSTYEIDSKMGDDLASLMSQNLHLGTMQPALNDLSSTPPTPQVIPQSASITYISQHYHHSSHVAPNQTDNDFSVSTILQQAGVNTHALLPSQIQLFKNAQPDQQARLVELWRIAPPTYGDQLPVGSTGENWPQTSLQQEEEAARQRYERQEQEKLRNLSVLPSQAQAEPYMHDGFGLSHADVANDGEGYRPATDPAYAPSREWWHMTGNEPIEHQYGLLQAVQMQYGSCGGMDRDHMMD